MFISVLWVGSADAHVTTPTLIGGDQQSANCGAAAGRQDPSLLET